MKIIKFAYLLILLLPCSLAAQGELKYTGKSFLALTVPNADTAADWYNNVFNLKKLKEINDTANKVSVRISGNENLLLEILALPGTKTFSDCGIPESKGNIYVQGLVKAGFYVEDLKAAEKYFISKKIKILHGPFSDDGIKARSFIIEDCNGNLLQFFEELNK